MYCWFLLWLPGKLASNAVGYLLVAVDRSWSRCGPRRPIGSSAIKNRSPTKEYCRRLTSMCRFQSAFWEWPRCTKKSTTSRMRIILFSLVQTLILYDSNQFFSAVLFSLTNHKQHFIEIQIQITTNYTKIVYSYSS